MALQPLEVEILAGLDAGRTLAEIGEQLSLSHSAVSKALHAAETREGLPLVEQTGRRLRLTPAGAYLMPAVRDLMAKLADLGEVVAAIQAGSAGPVRIVSTRSAGLNVLPTILDEFQEVFPRAAVELEIAPARHICAVLRDENYDMAIGPLTTIPPDLLVDRLYEDDPVFFVPPNSKFARKQAVSREDVRDETFIGPFTLPFWATLWEELVGGQPPMSRKMPLVDSDRVKQLVGSGTGIGVLFSSSVRRELEQGVFVPLPFSAFSRPHSLYIMRRAGGPLLSIAEQFRSFVIGRTRR
jgi:DNA-binding transcriptional LysR family regulator